MKHNYLMTISTILVLMICLAGCNSYDEGPALTLRSKKGRLTGTWKLVNAIGFVADGRTWTLERDESYREELGNWFEDGSWEFDNKKEDLIILEDDGDRWVYEILRLSNKEMRLKDDDLDEWHFEKQ